MRGAKFTLSADDRRRQPLLLLPEFRRRDRQPVNIRGGGGLRGGDAYEEYRRQSVVDWRHQRVRENPRKDHGSKPSAARGTERARNTRMKRGSGAKMRHSKNASYTRGRVVFTSFITWYARMLRRTKLNPFAELTKRQFLVHASTVVGVALRCHEGSLYEYICSGWSRQDGRQTSIKRDSLVYLSRLHVRLTD